MSYFHPTLILRHRKENLKKCTLSPLVTRNDIRFYLYPWKEEKPSLEGYVVLSLDAPPLTKNDASKGIFLIDGTWRYAEKMVKSLPLPHERRALPATLHTAYPRRQLDCPDPSRGLASIEALYAAYFILGRPLEGLLDSYRWKEEFCRLNSLPLPKSE